MDDQVSKFVQTLDPWKRLPLETFIHAVKHRRAGTESDKRIAFLLLDNVVELSLKLFLNRKGRKLAEDVTYSSLAGSLKALSGSLAQNLNLDELSEFHGYRNDLYHKKFGLVPDQASLEHFENLVIELINTIYKVDTANLDREIPIDIETAPYEQVQILKMLNSLFDDLSEEESRKLQVREIRERITSQLQKLKPEVEFAIEVINSKVLMPSFKRRMKALGEISMHIDQGRGYAERLMLNEEWINSFYDIIHDVTEDVILDNYEGFRKELQKEIIEIVEDGKTMLILDDPAPNTSYWQMVVDDPVLLYLLIIEKTRKIDKLSDIYFDCIDYSMNPGILISESLGDSPEEAEAAIEENITRIEDLIQTLVTTMQKIYLTAD